jgi:putative ATP-dependent endonuclease of OLD family
LIGKNNEGKSNLLSAFSVSMSILRSYAEERVQRQLLMHNIRYNYNYSDANYYQWSRDYPISLQKANKAQFSEFILEFLLSEDEIVSFKSKIGNKLNGILPISITIGSDNQPKIKVRKQGKGSKPLNSKSQKIAKYIAQNIEYNYIPAIRTDEESMEIINRQISQELQVLRNNKDYKAAIAKINELRKPVLAKLSGNIQEVLKSFLPDLSTVEINVRDDEYQYRRSFDFSLKIDDGTKTDLQNKGGRRIKFMMC